MTGQFKKTALYLAALGCLATTTGCQMAQQMGQGFSSSAGMGDEMQAQEKIYGAQPKTQTNPLGLKYPGRAKYLQVYPDAKPVAYGSPSLTSFYELAKANQGKEIKDEQFTYYFKYSSNGKQLNSCQFDNTTYENTKLLLKEKAGLMEPVFALKEGSFNLIVDQAATSRLYARLLKSLTLKPLSETVKYGKLFADKVNAETARRLQINEKNWENNDRTKTSGSASIGEVFDLFDKEKQYDSNEFQTIYNIKFKDVLSGDLFKGVDYLVVVNKDNFVVDRMPNYLTMRHMNEKVLKERLSKNMHLTGQSTQRETVMMYANYKHTVKFNLLALERGYNYANTSVQVFSIERLKTLTATGRTLVPDFKVTNTDVTTLDSLLNLNNNIAQEAFEEQQNCSKGATFGTVFSDSCWKSMRESYPHFWRMDFNKVAHQRTAVMTKYDSALNALDEVKKTMQLNTGLKRNKLDK